MTTLEQEKKRMKFAIVLKLPVSQGDIITNIMQVRGPIQHYCFVFQPYLVNFADLHHPSFVEGTFACTAMRAQLT
jgi:hypothetical protein